MRIDELERELRAERAELDPEIARRLDEWAATGFARDRGLGPRAGASSGAFGRLWRRLRVAPPRRVLVPVGSTATMLIVLAVAISQSGEFGNGEPADPRPQTVAEESGSDAGSAASQAPAGSQRQPEFFSSGEGEAAAVEEYGLGPLPDARASADEPSPPTDSIARGENQRIVDATARITLGAETEEVQEVANGVIDVADRFDGVVRNSQVTTDQAGARAAFELEIPYRDLDAALTEISALADVISRTEGGEDITAQAVRARRQLARVFDQIAAARIERIEVDTHEERLIIDARLRSLEATADSLQTEIDGVKRQGRFATVNVEITSNGPDSDAGGGWSLSDALDDAGRVLEVMGGIALISLAVLVPLALVGLLVWLVVTRTRQHSRERALD